MALTSRFHRRGLHALTRCGAGESPCDIWLAGIHVGSTKAGKARRSTCGAHAFIHLRH